MTRVRGYFVVARWMDGGWRQTSRSTSAYILRAMYGEREDKCDLIIFTQCYLLLISVVRPTLEYGSEVWEGNKAQAAALESVMIGGAKRILGCSSRTCNEAVRGDMGLDSLQGRRDKAKLKWWYKVATMPEHRYSRKLFVQEWNVKPRRGRQRKYWCKVVDHLFSSLGLDKAEWLEDIRKGSC